MAREGWRRERHSRDAATCETGSSPLPASVQSTNKLGGTGQNQCAALKLLYLL